MKTQNTKTQNMLNIHEVATMVDLSKATIYRLINNGKFPPPKKLSVRRVCWFREQIEDWLNTLSSN